MRDVPTTMSDKLLRWYDAQARELPWRVPPALGITGVRPDPYRVWLSEIMLQQTTVAVVQGYYRAFVRRWPDIHALANARSADLLAAWAGLGYYARAHNLLATARIVSREFGGRFPQDRASLLNLPGIGPYTAAAIAAIAFDQRETVVDGNVERVMARLFAIDEPLAFAKTTLRRAAASLTPDRRAGDHAQAVMDLGATICTPRNPDCADCPLGANCQAFATGQVARLPKRAPRAKKPRRLGVAYVLWRSDGALLIENRPVNGLLGGMPGFPTTDWCDAPENNPPAPADWQVLPGEIRHAFTHFHLTLSVQVALAGRGANPARGAFVPPAQFNPGGLPTVMRKVHDLAIGAGMPA